MMNKKIFTYFIGMLGITAILLLISFMSYRIALYKFNSQSIERGNDQFYSLEDKVIKSKNLSNNINVNNEESTTNEDVALVDSMTESIISSKTKFVLQAYDLVSEQITEEALNPPDYLIGLTRGEVIEYLNEYMLDIKLSEFEKGLMSYELISFSEKEVVLRKSYDSRKVEYKYYLAVIDGVITVFYSDLITVFEYTDIQIENLSEDEQIELMNGKFVKDIEELYGILENYSS